ncbi:MAG: hypothetical protein ACI8S6_001125 [Myxococcota bacterium]|jgi:hypothetical protein
MLLSLLGCLVDHDLYEQRRAELIDEDGDGYNIAAGDCDDADPARYPGAAELCDEADNDCDGDVDEDLDESYWFTDIDGDGYGTGEPVLACGPPPGTASGSSDCDDQNASVHPGADEVWYDGTDQDCSGEGSDYDADQDGEDSEQYGGLDCDDADPDAHPDREEGWLDDGVDNDCDGQAREALTWNPAEATTRFNGTAADGELGRRLGFSDADNCLLMAAPYADITDAYSGVVYAASSGGSGTIEADSLGQITVSQGYTGLSNLIEINEEGTVLLVGAGKGWLLDASVPCGGTDVDVDSVALLTVESTEELSYFGTGGTWLPDYDGTGISALAVSALGAAGGGVSRGAIYIWESPPADGSILVADDADVIFTGDHDGAGLNHITSVSSSSGTPDLLLSQGSSAVGGVLVARVEAGTASGRVSEVADGTILSDGAQSAPQLRVIGDVDRDGVDNFMLSAPLGMWDLDDIDGSVMASDVPTTFGWKVEGEWINLVESIGDIDGDERPDMAILADDWPASTHQGALGILTADELTVGSLNTFENIRLQAVGEASGDSFGYRVLPVGDFDSDGRDDVAVSAYGTDPSGASSGTVYLMPIPLSH